MPSLAVAEKVLKDNWGFTQFRPAQVALMEAILLGKDVLGILPTGGGKSLCYQVPGLLQDGLTIVVSPLVALMEDQVAQLKKRKIPAACLHQGVYSRQAESIWNAAKHHKIKFLYLAPERLETEFFKNFSAQLQVSILAVDEAHCISDWGEQFRPSYQKIAEAKTLLNNPQIIAVTATATPLVRQDILKHLAITDAEVVVQGFNRSNLVLGVQENTQKQAKVKSMLQKVAGSGILYTATRNRTVEWAKWLQQQGISANAYHAGFEHDERKKIQEDWISGKTRIICATNAFGMGIDKADVRFVIHTDLPPSLEAYYQEAGRGGRDGKTAFALLLWNENDVQLQESLIEESYPQATEVRKVYELVCDLNQVPVATLPQNPLWVDVAKIAKISHFSPLKVENSLHLLANLEVWETLNLWKNTGQIQFRQPVEHIRAYARETQNAKLGAFIIGLLRYIHADAFSQWHSVDWKLLSQKLGIDIARVQKGLDFLAQRGILSWHTGGNGQWIMLREARSQKLPLDGKQIKQTKQRALFKLKEVHRYALAHACRMQYLRSYFGERAEKCGKCDVCRGQSKPLILNAKHEPYLKQLLLEIHQEVPENQWLKSTSIDFTNQLLGYLMQEELIYIPNPATNIFKITPKAHKFIP